MKKRFSIISMSLTAASLLVNMALAQTGNGDFAAYLSQVRAGEWYATFEFSLL